MDNIQHSDLDLKAPLTLDDDLNIWREKYLKFNNAWLGVKAWGETWFKDDISRDDISFFSFFEGVNEKTTHISILRSQYRVSSDNADHHALLYVVDSDSWIFSQNKNSELNQLPSVEDIKIIQKSKRYSEIIYKLGGMEKAKKEVKSTKMKEASRLLVQEAITYFQGTGL